MRAEELRKSILQQAIQGKLVKQDPNDEPASVLLERIKAEKDKLVKEGKIKKDKEESYIYKGDDNRYYEKIGENEIVDITDDLSFEIPENWIFVRQKTICWLENLPKEKGEELPYLEVKYLRGQIEPTMLTSGCIVYQGDYAILVDGENSGEKFIIKEKGYLGSTFKKLSIVKNINIKYLSLIFLNYKDYYKNNKKGAAIPHLNKDIFANLFFPLPPLEEQERIVKRIEELMPLVDEYARLEAKDKELDEKLPAMLKQSILQYAMEGKLVKQDPNDEPASVLLERIKAEKEKLIKEGKIKRDKNETTIIQDDDKNYYENNQLFISLKEILKVSSGKGINVRNLNYSKKYPVYGGNGIVGTHDEYIVGENTIIIGRVGANCGCVHITNKKAFVTDNALIVDVLSKNVIYDYLFFALKSIDYKDSISSTAQPLISGRIIYDKKILLPSIKIQKDIVYKLNQIENIINFI